MVRALGNKTRASHFESLKKIIQDTVRDGLQPEVKEEIIEELDERGVSVETLVLATIKKEVVRTVSTRHTAGTAFRAIGGAVASKVLSKDIGRAVDSTTTSPTSPKDEGDGANKKKEDERRIAEQWTQFGFMVSAPIAVIATIPWVLGAGIWPFMARVSTKLRCNPVFLTKIWFSPRSTI